MNQVVKEKWTAALRSNDYRQGRWALKRADGGFCCLGVLCDLYLKEHQQEWEPTVFGSRFSCFGRTGVLPVQVQKWAEVEEIPVFGSINALDANDREGLTFNEIADLVDQYL